MQVKNLQMDLLKVLKFFDENNGTHFDPQLVKLFHENVDELVKFQEGN